VFWVGEDGGCSRRTRGTVPDSGGTDPFDPLPLLPFGRDEGLEDPRIVHDGFPDGCFPEDLRDCRRFEEVRSPCTWHRNADRRTSVVGDGNRGDTTALPEGEPGVVHADSERWPEHTSMMLAAPS